MTSISTQREEKRREEHSTHTHTHMCRVQNKGAERNFYVPIFFLSTFTTFESILKRERISLSSWLRNQIEEYVRLHELGNPQQRLDTIAQTGRPYRAPILCHKCKVKASRRVILNDGSVLFSCPGHMPALSRVQMWKAYP